VLRVTVFADGRLTVDGKLSSIDSLVESLSVLRKSHGTVWYYSEPSRKTPRIATQVLLAITSADVRILFAGNPDLSAVAGKASLDQDVTRGKI